MIDSQLTIGDLGEKRLLRDVVLPLVNPLANPFLAGDDCGIVEVPDGHYVCTSTDRVPWDLTAHRLGIMSVHELGYYLGILNISDIAAMGAVPVGLLLNLALPSNFLLAHCVELISGVLAVGARYDVPILGGDLSDASEPSLVATSLGIGKRGHHLHRSGAQAGDLIFASGRNGLAATALRYFRDAKPAGMNLSSQEEELLRRQLTSPVAQVDKGKALAGLGVRATAMDNTDGLGQTLFELAEASSLHFVVHRSLMPDGVISGRVADYLHEDPFDLIMGPGADFNLVGTAEAHVDLDELGLFEIGRTEAGQGISVIADGIRSEVEPRGWNYFSDATGS